MWQVIAGHVKARFVSGHDFGRADGSFPSRCHPDQARLRRATGGSCCLPAAPGLPTEQQVPRLLESARFAIRLTPLGMTNRSSAFAARLKPCPDTKRFLVSKICFALGQFLSSRIADLSAIIGVSTAFFAASAAIWGIRREIDEQRKSRSCNRKLQRHRSDDRGRTCR